MTTFNLSVAKVSGRAEALGTVQRRAALGVDAARARLQTRQHALVVLAALVRVAVAVRLALVAHAPLGRPSAETRRTEADGAVVRDAALGADAAHARARVDALAADARLLRRAVAAGTATDGARARVADDALRTLVVVEATAAADALNARLAATAAGVRLARHRAVSSCAGAAALAAVVFGYYYRSAVRGGRATEWSLGAAALRIADRSRRT